MSDDTTSRAEFEAWISAPPFERPIARYSSDPKRTNWPRQYRNYFTQLAWEAWRARDAEVAAIRAEIIATWRAMQGVGQSQAYRILERMVDRLGYCRTDGNPSLAQLEDETQGGAR